ncbi:MAG TPA: hemolysin family protein [Terrimesophilobacter sp.]|nr:hemolysin family protein [Terrimesophilobacter sp.]
MTDWWGIAWLFLLLALNAFFVGAEFAVISARRSQIEPLAEAGNRRAKTTLYAMEHATLMLATSQLGITVCSLLILNVSEPAIHHLLEIPLALTGWPIEVIGTIAFIIALILVSYLHVVFGEMVPKNIAFSIPDRAALALAPPLVWVSRVFGFLIIALNATANGVLRLFGVTPKNEATSAYTIDEVANIVAQSQKEGVLRDDSGALSAAFEFTEKQAKDVAIPLEKIVSLTEGATPGQVAKAVAQHGFSRYVLVDGDGLPSGYLHLKDVIDLDSEEEVDSPVPSRRVRRLVSISETTELEDALAAMRRSGVHLATVYDEVGEPSGVLFLEDIIEELVGEVQDATRRLP